MKWSKIREALRWRGYDLIEKGWGRNKLERAFIDLILLPNDFHIIRDEYRKVFDCYPRLLFPKTFNEKIQHDKIFNRRCLNSVLADKIAVRGYVEERLGPEVLTRLLWTGTDLRKAREMNIQEPFILKDSNGSQATIMVEKPDTFDWEAVIEHTRGWPQRHYDAYAGEYQYRWVKSSYLIEALLPKPADGGSLRDYKFFCFHERAEFVQIDVDRPTRHVRAIVDRDFNLLPVGLCYPRYTGDLRKPDCFEQMLNNAERLAAGMKFVRVDWYDCDKPVFGEMTIHPGAGLEKFDPPEWAVEFGKR
jgi:hypothetical protein